VVCVVQVYRFPAIPPTPDNPNPNHPSGDAGGVSNRITLGKKPDGGLSLTVGQAGE
jgi:hypothetical protein